MGGGWRLHLHDTVPDKALDVFRIRRNSLDVETLGNRRRKSSVYTERGLSLSNGGRRFGISIKSAIPFLNLDGNQYSLDSFVMQFFPGSGRLGRCLGHLGIFFFASPLGLNGQRA